MLNPFTVSAEHRAAALNLIPNPAELGASSGTPFQLVTLLELKGRTFRYAIQLVIYPSGLQPAAPLCALLGKQRPDLGSQTAI